MSQGSSIDGMSEVDASDVPPHVEDKFDTMPARIPAVRRALGEFRQNRIAGSFCEEGSGHEGPTQVLVGGVQCSIENGDD